MDPKYNGHSWLNKLLPGGTPLIQALHQALQVNVCPTLPREQAAAWWGVQLCFTRHIPSKQSSV